MSNKTGTVLVVMTSLAFLASLSTLALAYLGVKRVDAEIANVKDQVEKTKTRAESIAKKTQAFILTLQES